MAEEAVNPASALQGIEYQGGEFASLLKKEFKPKSDDAKSAVEQAVLTLAQQALSQTNLIGSDVVMSIEAMIAELQRAYEVYFIIPTAAGHGGDREILGHWKRLLGQHVIALDDLDAVCETIALTVGLGEGRIDLDEGLADLTDVGSAAGASVGRALALVRPRGAVVRAAITPGTGPDGNERL